MKDGLCNIRNGIRTKRRPSTSETQKYDILKYVARRDKSLAMLSVDPSLLYLIGDPEDPGCYCVEKVSRSIPKEDLGH